MNLREFGDWALAQGIVGNPGSGSYAGECVSLIQQYLYKVFDIPFEPHGNAKDWAENVPQGFQKVGGNPQKGDILVYGDNLGGGYGHLVIVDVNNNRLEQNGDIYHKITYNTHIYGGYIAILRPINQNKLGIIQKNILHLHANVDKWRIYPLGVQPIVGNEAGFILPQKFGGLDYEIQGWSQDNVAIIDTRDFGRVQIYCGPDTDCHID